MAHANLLRVLMIMACTLGCIFGCTLSEIKVHDFTLATSKGQTRKFYRQHLADAPGSIVLKFTAVEKQFEFELQRARVFGKHAVVRIIGDVSFHIRMCNGIWRVFFQTRLIVCLLKNNKISYPQQLQNAEAKIYSAYR